MEEEKIPCGVLSDPSLTAVFVVFLYVLGIYLDCEQAVSVEIPLLDIQSNGVRSGRHCVSSFQLLCNQSSFPIQVNCESGTLLATLQLQLPSYTLPQIPSLPPPYFSLSWSLLAFRKKSGDRNTYHYPWGRRGKNPGAR